MSRKRKKAPELEAVPEVIPEDVLAEGSGPVQAVAHVGMEEAEPEAPKPIARPKSRSPKASHATADVIEAAAEDIIADADVESVADLVAAAEAVAEGEDAPSDPTGDRDATPVRGAKRGGRKPKRGATKGHATDSSSDDVVAEVVGDGDGDGDRLVVGEVEGDAILDDVTDGEAMIATAGDASDDAFDGDPLLVQGGIDGDGEAIVGDGIEVVEGELAAEGATSDDATATLPTSAAALDAGQLKQLVEALVFASDKPITVVRLRQLTRVADVKRLEDALAELATDYTDRGLVLQQVSGGFQFRTRTQWSAWVQQLIAGRPVRLTRAQLETLAIIAYRQPITRPEIDDIRGVDSSATLKLLIDRTLIRILGKKEEVGRPMLYGTTKEFLDFFSLGDLRELPTLREYSELTDESRQVITDRLGDLPEGGEGGGAPPVDGGGMAGAPGGDAGLGAAAEPTAADLIARYVAELDASPTDVASVEHAATWAAVDVVFDLTDAEPASLDALVDELEGSLVDLDPFAAALGAIAAVAIQLSAPADDPAGDVHEGKRASTDSEAAGDFAPESTDPEAVAAEVAPDFEGDSTNPGIALESLDADEVSPPDMPPEADFEPESTDSEAAAIQLESNDSDSPPRPTGFEPESTDEAAAMHESIEPPGDGEPEAEHETAAQLDGEPGRERETTAQLDGGGAAPVSEPDGLAAGSGGFAANTDTTEDILAEGSGGIPAIAGTPVDQSDKASVIAAALAAMAESAPPASTTAEMAAQAGDLAVIDGSTDAIVEPGD